MNNSSFRNCIQSKISNDEVENIPASYWQSKEYNDDYVRNMNAFIRQLNHLTSQISSNNSLPAVYLKIGRGNWNILYDDILYPYWQRFAMAIKSCNRKIDILEITNVRLTKQIFEVLALALQKKNLRWMKFSGNHIGKYGIMFVSTVLRACPSVEKLWLDHNKIDDLGAATQLSQALNNHPRLSALYLRCCGLGENNIPILSVILNGAKDVEHVNLSGNEIGPQGYGIISSMLATDPGMESINLDVNCEGGYNDSAHLAQALRRNKNLKWIYLCVSLAGKEVLGNAIFDDSSLNAAADSNHTCLLNVSGNDKNIARLLRMNKKDTAKGNRNRKIFLTLRDNVGQLELRCFNDVHLGLMPSIFELLQRDPSKDSCLSNVFEVLRWKMPSLFER